MKFILIITIVMETDLVHQAREPSEQLDHCNNVR